MKAVYGSPKNNAGRVPRTAQHWTKCYNCGASCVRGEYELEYWRGRENGYEAETVCLNCHTTHAFSEYLNLG